MNKIKSLALAAVAALAFIVAGTQSAQAGGPLRFGIKAGATVNSLKFNSDLLSSSNRCGFTAGLNAQFSAPIIGVGVDASVMYTRRQASVTTVQEDWVAGPGAYQAVVTSSNVHSDYIEIPVLFRWNIGLPGVGKIVTPYLATGPDFSFLMSKKNAENALANKTFDFAWDFGLGLRLVDHLELGAFYGLGISNAASGDQSLHGKNRFWTVTAAWLF